MTRTRPARLAVLLLGLGLLLPGVAHAQEPDLVPSVDALTARPAPLSAGCPDGLVPAARFVDTARHRFAAEIDCLAWYGIARGVDDTVFAPQDPVSRRQAAQFLARVIEQAVVLPDADAAAPFDDVGAGDAGAREIAALSSPTLRALFDEPVLEGVGDGDFRPGATLERGQFASMLARTLRGMHRYGGGQQVTVPAAVPGAEPFDDLGSLPARQRADIGLLAASGIIEGRGTAATFDPGEPVTRGQAAAMLARLQAVLVAEDRVALPSPDVRLTVDRRACDATSDEAAEDDVFCSLQQAVDVVAADHSDARPVIEVADHRGQDDAPTPAAEDLEIPSGLRLTIVGLAADDEPVPVVGSVTVRGAATVLDLVDIALVPREGADPDEGVGLSAPDGATVRLHGSVVRHPGVAVSLDHGAALVLARSAVGGGRIGVELADGRLRLAGASVRGAEVGVEQWPGSALVARDSTFERLGVALSLGDGRVSLTDNIFRDVTDAYVQDHTGRLDLGETARSNTFVGGVAQHDAAGVRALVRQPD